MRKKLLDKTFTYYHPMKKALKDGLQVMNEVKLLKLPNHEDVINNMPYYLDIDYSFYFFEKLKIYLQERGIKNIEANRFEQYYHVGLLMDSNSNIYPVYNEDPFKVIYLLIRDR